MPLVAIAFVYFAAVSVALAIIDVRIHRLPDRIVLPSYVVAGVLLTAGAAVLGDGGALVRAGCGMLAMFVFYLVLRLVSPAGMGGGDVKLAGLIGLFLGWIGWAALIVGALAGFVLGGLWATALVVGRRAGRRTAIPFGPWMILGGWVGILIGETVGRTALPLGG